jgi:dTDP-4-dehydrorhamnose 3,5-epimerase
LKVIETGLPGCLVVEPRVFEDARGFFYEAFNHDKLAPHGLRPAFVQGNVSSSHRGVLRGLHYQWPQPQGKYLTVLDGEVWDVAVDIRRDSPTFARWTGVVLSARNKRQLWIPEGFAHGYVVLSELATVSYLCTATYDARADMGIRWDDPRLAIDWPLAEPLLSDKDRHALLLDEIPEDRLPACAPCPAR